MVAEENQFRAAKAQIGKIALQDRLAERVYCFQTAGIDYDLIHTLLTGGQGVDQFMGGSTVEVAIESEADTVFRLASKSIDLEVHGHRLPSFRPPHNGGIHCRPRAREMGGRRLGRGKR